MGSAHRVEMVSGVSTFNVDDFGPEIACDVHVGSTAVEVGLRLREAKRPPSFGANVLDALAAKLGLTVRRAATRTRPLFAETVMYCRSLDLEVAPGRVIGLVDRDTVQTEEGPGLSLELAGRLYRERERDVNEWKVHGEPELSLVNPAVDTRTTTCTQLVNRIPDVLEAPPGLLTVAELPTPRYRQRPFATDRESTVR